MSKVNPLSQAKAAVTNAQSDVTFYARKLAKLDKGMKRYEEFAIKLTEAKAELAERRRRLEEVEAECAE